jgi:predicted CopG family antitoxin
MFKSFSKVVHEFYEIKKRRDCDHYLFHLHPNIKKRKKQIREGYTGVVVFFYETKDDKVG